MSLLLLVSLEYFVAEWSQPLKKQLNDFLPHFGNRKEKVVLGIFNDSNLNGTMNMMHKLGDIVYIHHRITKVKIIFPYASMNTF